MSVCAAVSIASSAAKISRTKQLYYNNGTEELNFTAMSFPNLHRISVIWVVITHLPSPTKEVVNLSGETPAVTFSELCFLLSASISGSRFLLDGMKRWFCIQHYPSKKSALGTRDAGEINSLRVLAQ
jgi:hypothetical protein